VRLGAAARLPFSPATSKAPASAAVGFDLVEGFTGGDKGAAVGEENGLAGCFRGQARFPDFAAVGIQAQEAAAAGKEDVAPGADRRRQAGFAHTRLLP